MRARERERERERERGYGREWQMDRDGGIKIAVERANSAEGY